MSMNLFEEAIIYATIMHQGTSRKMSGTPYIMHPLEVAQIISTMTDDIEVISAGVLHDIVEDTDGSLAEIRARFGDRVADIVDSETEIKNPGEDESESWLRRKEESILRLKNTRDLGVKMLWLADKLSNIRSYATQYSEMGDSLWQNFHQTDPKMHLWYYKSIAECLEMDLNKTGAYKEFIKHINFLWPGSFDSQKSRYKKYRNYSIDGCKMIGKGAKGTVYRYDDELIIKVYNENNTFKDIERENMLAKKAFVAGIPTAISFGIVTVGKQYGSMFELLDSSCISELIALDNGRVEFYADQMADLARIIHTTDGKELELPDYSGEVYQWIHGGIEHESPEITEEITRMFDALPKVNTMIHGDFHTGNVMVQNGEPLLIDMDRISTCHPIVELCGVYMFYRGFGELDPKMIENFMGFDVNVADAFYVEFLKHYFQTEDEELLKEINDKLALLCYVRLMRRVYKKGSNLSEENAKARDYYMSKIKELLNHVKDFEIPLRE